MSSSTGRRARTWTSRSAILAALLLGVPFAVATGPQAAAAGPGHTGTNSGWGDAATDAKAKKNGKNTPSLDAGSLASVTTAIGAREVWKTKDSTGRAVTGQGVTVALLDTGVDTTVPGLGAAGKVIEGPDLSLEANSADLRGRDTFGHGTHLGSIIAARDATPINPRTGQPEPADTNVQLGVAPDARLLALKLATTDGSTDVSQVIAALDWVVQHRDDKGMRIRVVNLAFGTLSAQPYQLDPLAAAAENAWRHGIVVVVSAGNEGRTATRLSNPAIDPYVLAVGASDAKTVVSKWTHPTVAEFSSRGDGSRSVDLVAPGASIAGLRAPGSFVDRNHPQGRVDGDTTGRLFRGSGTSQAAAVTSGAVALLLQVYPELTPDQVKAALVASAGPVDGLAIDKGAGTLDVAGALAEAKKIVKDAAKGRDATVQNFPIATGLGSLEAARGGSNLIDAETGAILRGEIDVQNQPWNPATWSAASFEAEAWAGGLWNGVRWTGDSWSGARWTGARWTGARWTGARWTELDWSGARWTGARWTGARWTGARWTDQDWP